MRGLRGRKADGPDDIDSWLRQLDEGTAGKARFREPSAAERARKPAGLTRWRNTRKARKLRKPVTGPQQGPDGAPTRSRPRSSGRGHTRSYLAALAVVLAVGGIAIAALTGHNRNPGASALAPVTNGPVPAELPSPTVAQPFTGTPAQSYADGAAGIVTPRPHAIRTFTAGQVAMAYRKTRQLLVAADLNGPTLRGGSPAAFAGLLIRQQRSFFISNLDKMGTPHKVRSTRSWLAAFAPGTTQLVGNVIKVRGAMQATATRYTGRNALLIRADYLFVYPVERPGQPATLMRVLDQTNFDVYFAAFDDPGGPLLPWVDVTGGGEPGALCGVNDGYIHPDFPGGPQGKVRPTGPPVNPYALSTMPTHDTCQNTTGT